MSNPSVPAAHHVAIRPRSGWRALDLREVWQYRNLLLTLGGRDVKVRYKQTALGATWIVVQPLLGAGILSFVFGTVAKLPMPNGIPPFLFTFVGLLAWGVFAKTLGRTAGSMVSNQQLVSKVYFPRILLPLSSVFTALVDFGVTLLMLAAMLAVYWHAPGLHVLMMPVAVVLLLMFALGVGFCATSVAVRFRDVDYVIPVLTQLLMYASPVAYDVSVVPERYRDLYLLNPLAAILQAFRWSVLGVGEVPWNHLGYSAATAFAVFVAGAYFFKRMEKSFADII